MTRLHLLCLTAVTLATVAAFSLAALASPPTIGERGADVLVRLHSGEEGSQLQSWLLAGEDVVALLPERGIYRLRSVLSQKETLAVLRRNPAVVYAEPNGAVRIAASPDDPDYASRQWAPAAIGAPAAWDVVTGSNAITIAVIDTGIDMKHPDLKDKLVTGTTFAPGTTSAQDDHGHGTHVAGIAAASTNNGIGMAGVSWGARLMPVKVLDRMGFGTYAELINGIYYAASHGAQILNMSLSAEGYSQAVQDALDYAHGRGALLVAAAGNCGQGGAGCSGINPILYPAANRHVISVAATDDQNRRAAFSSYNAYVDLAAPGVGIYSTHWQSGISTYFWMNGTSQAAPHVAGLAALVWSGRPWLSNDDVERLITITARDVNAAALPGVDNHLGWGLVDAARAVDRTPPTSSVLPLPTAQRDPQFAVLWSGADENSGLQSYTIQYRDGDGQWIDWQVGVAITQAAFVGVPGHTYYFQSSATDLVGNVEPFPGGDGDTHIHISTCMVGGVVRDNRRAPIAGALVSLDPEGSRTISDEAGRFVLAPQVCEGAQAVTASRAGFGTLPAQQGILLAAGATLTGFDLHLPPVDNALRDRNWDFESGSLAPHWLVSGVPEPQAAFGWGHSGHFSAFLGAPMASTSPGGESAMAMTATVPITAYRPTLSFLYRIVTMDNGLHDYFEARVNGVAVLRDSYAGPDYGTLRDLGWRQMWVDLSPYAGKSVEMRLVVVQGQAYASYPTGAYVDEVSLGSASGGPFASWLPIVTAGSR